MTPTELATLCTDTVNDFAKVIAQRDHYAALLQERSDRLRRYEEQEQSQILLEDQLRLLTRFERDFADRVIGLRDDSCVFALPNHALWPVVMLEFEDEGVSVRYTLDEVKRKAVIYRMEIETH